MSIEPIRDPDDPGGGGVGGGGINPPPSQLPGLGVFTRKRYTSNLAVTEEFPAVDLLHDVIFPSARLYFTQSQKGKISLRNKKPVSYAYATSGFSAGASSIAVDDVSQWIGNIGKWLLISPHTTESEIRQINSANYSSAQNSVSLTSTGGLFSISGFSGGNGFNTPATATITVTAATPDTVCSITLDGIEILFRTASAGETTASIASYLAAQIISHPSLLRRFHATVSGSVVTIKAKFGSLGIAPTQFAKSAPLVNPVTAPTLSAMSGGNLAAGDYAVGYSAVNAAGETLLSKYRIVTLSAGQRISVSGVSLPSGATGARWYVSPEANSRKLRFVAQNNGGGFVIDALPLLSASLPPDLNTTGAEVMRIAAVFSDRAEARSGTSRSNVLKATFSWLLGNREKSVNRVDLKYRDASQDWRLIDLRIRDDAHIAKTKKISKYEINGQAIDNTDQAYRIGTGALAEKRDADFFYRWKSTRAALLLQEGDVCAITDDGSGVYNLPVMIEQIEFDIPTGSMPMASFTGRKYASSMYDDSIVERVIPIVVEDYSVPPPALTNFALASNGSTIAVSSTAAGSAWNLINGSRVPNGDFYANGFQTNGSGQWIEITFPGMRYISRVDLITANANNVHSSPEPTLVSEAGYMGDVTADVYYWTGSSWSYITTLTSGTKQWKQASFSAVSTTKLRFELATGSGAVFALAVEAWG